MRIANIFLIGAVVLAGCQAPSNEAPSNAPDKSEPADKTPVKKTAKTAPKTAADTTDQRVGVRIETLGIT